VGVDRRIPGTGFARRRSVAGLAFRYNTSKRPKLTPPEQDFEEFFRSAYRSLLRDVIFAGGEPQDAEDALSAAMEEVLRRWDAIDNPRAYARRAAISNLIKNKERGLQRTVDRLIEKRHVPAAPDPGLSTWEEQEWVTQLLKSLPAAQQEVLAYMIDEFTQQEIAQLFGKTEAAVRQNLYMARKRLAACIAEADRQEEAR
jgi:RNA polymerase sigma factor (sigma-70 family)